MWLALRPGPRLLDAVAAGMASLGYVNEARLVGSHSHNTAFAPLGSRQKWVRVTTDFALKSRLSTALNS